MTMHAYTEQQQPPPKTEEELRHDDMVTAIVLGLMALLLFIDFISGPDKQSPSH
jgi:hypothetical protein